MKYADLHIHSNYSDGTMTPEKIIKIAKNKGVQYISITDHDSVASQYITQNTYSDISIISGIELSSEYREFEIHLLGYFIDIENDVLRKTLDMLNKERMNRVESILIKLRNNGININFNDLEISNNSTVGRSHIANAIVKKGYYDNYKIVFTSLLTQGKEAYVKGNKLGYKDAINTIKTAGGIPILAHPGQIHKGLAVESIIKELKCYGVEGLEVYHPCHYKNQTNYFYNIAKKNKLLITGGSDYHGNDQIHNSGLGNFGINQELLNKLLKYKHK